MNGNQISTDVCGTTHYITISMLVPSFGNVINESNATFPSASFEQVIAVNNSMTKHIIYRK